jgi:hypothetical protein
LKNGLTSAQIVALEVNAIISKYEKEREIAMTQPLTAGELAIAESLLTNIREAQTKLWDLSQELEAVLGCAVDTTRDMEGETIASILERNELI